MRPGSVIVDLPAEAGGNCELTRPGETYTTDGGVIVAAPLNLPSRMAQHASQLYARNVQSLLELMTGEDGALELDWEDEVIKGACVAATARGWSADGPPDRAGDPRAGRVRRLRGDLEGAEHAAHAADVGHQRDPRHRGGRRPAGRSGRPTGCSRSVLLVIAIAFGTINVVGGFLVTDRMLGMFKGKKPDPDE